jgi:transcription initiation factor TFIIIB Brf1 subunit/transcription initiation factor TFIIB
MILKSYSNMNDIAKYEELFGLVKPKIDIEEDMYLKNNIIMCKDCNLPTISNGINIWECKKCGCFVEETIDATLSFNDKNELEGTTVSKFLPNSSKSTIMINNFNTNYDQLRKQKVHSWSNMTYSERSLNNVFTDIKLRAINNSILENITFCAQEIYMEISKIYIPRGNLRKGIIAACLFQACKKKGFPRTTKEIADMFQIEEKILTKGNKKFNEMWLKIGKTYIHDVDDGLKYLGRFCSMLTTNARLLEFSKIIIRFIEKHKILQKHTPISVTASAIYLATLILRLPISRLRITEVTKVSNVTIVNCYKKIKKHDTFQNLSFEFPIQKLVELPELPELPADGSNGSNGSNGSKKRGRKKIYV